MKEKKTELRFFTVAQWQKEQDYLRSQHQKGWKFTGLRGLGVYHFERCQPEDVVYQLDYNPEGLSHKSQYIRMFSDCGWEYLQDYVGYSYFRKPAAQMQGEEEIFCDDSSRLDMMKRVFKGRIIPLLILFFLQLLPNLLRQLSHPVLMGPVFTIIFSALFVIYLILFLMFGYQFWRYWKSV